MSAVMMPPAPAVVAEPKCEIELVFDSSFIELLRLAPKNPLVRALVLKRTGKMPGPELETFAQITEWVETTFDMAALRPQGRQPASEEGISINVDFSEIEHGRASYSVPRSGQETFRMGADELLEIVQGSIEAGEDLNHVVELISAQVDEDAWSQCEPAMDDYGDYDYADHDSEDCSDCETTCSETEIRAAVLRFLTARHPELVAQL